MKNKNKLIVVIIGIIFMLVSITMVSAIDKNIIEKKESPLFTIKIKNVFNDNERNEIKAIDYIGQGEVKILNTLKAKVLFPEFNLFLPDTIMCVVTLGLPLCTLLICPWILLKELGNGIRSVLNLQTCNEKTCDFWCTLDSPSC